MGVAPRELSLLASAGVAAEAAAAPVTMAGSARTMSPTRWILPAGSCASAGPLEVPGDEPCIGSLVRLYGEGIVAGAPCLLM